MFVKTPSIYLEPYMAILMPLSGANCHIYKPPWQSGYAARKKSAYLIIGAVVWGSILHVVFCF
jgi:hypothetical protein